MVPHKDEQGAGLGVDCASGRNHTSVVGCKAMEKVQECVTVRVH